MNWLFRVCAGLGILCAGILHSLGASALSFTLSGGFFYDAETEKVASDTLFQLVNLGPNGRFDPVVEGRWTSGDDVLVDLPYAATGDFDSAAAMDLAEGNGLGPGLFSRRFDLPEQVGVAAAGDPVGLRWFPQRSADDFGTIAPSLGEAYGEVTVSTATGGNGLAWVLPEASSLPSTFEPVMNPEAAAQFSLDATPGFSGGAGKTVVRRKPWAVGQLLAAEEVPTPTGEAVLRKALYRIVEPQEEFRIVRSWHAVGSGDDAAPLRWQAALAGQVVASIDESSTRDAVAQALIEAGFEVSTGIGSSSLLVARLPAPEEWSIEQLSRLADDLSEDATINRGGQVAFFPNELAFPSLSLVGIQPNDPLYADQEALRTIGLPEAWLQGTGGSESVVVLVDSGINLSEPELSANLWRNPKEIIGNGRDDDENGFIDDQVGWDFVENDASPQDQDGHGTRMAGIIAASGNNGRGPVGVAWTAQMLPLKVGVRSFAVSRLIHAIDYAIDLKLNRGVEISVMNHAYRLFSEQPPSAVTPLRLAFDRAEDAGILMVASAGNDGRDNDQNGSVSQPAYVYPSDFPTVFSVAASGAGGVLASDSSYGVASVDLAAPGAGNQTMDLTGGFEPTSGTSAAAALVSGAALLAKERFPGLSPGQLRRLLRDSARPRLDLGGRIKAGGELSVDRLLAAGAVEVFQLANWGEGFQSLPESALTADPDQDGRMNALEFAFGSSPLSADAAAVFSIEQGAFEITLTPGSLALLDPRWMTSTDLASADSWVPVSSDWIDFNALPERKEEVRFRLRRELLPRDAKRFFRISFDANPIVTP